MKSLGIVLILVWFGVVDIAYPGSDTGLPPFDSLWDFTDPQATELQFKELLPRAHAAGNVKYEAGLLTQIARCQGLQRQFEQAQKTLENVEPLLKQAGPEMRVRYLLERGRVYNSCERMPEAGELFMQAWKLATEHEFEFHAVDALHMLAISEPPEKQLAWAEKAIAAAEAASDKRAHDWLGPLYNNTGWTYHDLKQYRQALRLFEKSLAWREERKDIVGIRIARWTIGRCYRSLGRIDDALKLQVTLQAEIRQAGDESDGYFSEELGECYLLKGDAMTAQSHFARAYALLSSDQWIKANEPERLQRLRSLAGLPETKLPTESGKAEGASGS